MSDAPPPILDLTYLAEAADGDTDFIKEILGDYLEEMDKQMAEITALLAGTGLGDLVRSFHTIKGASANVGANRVRKTAARLETQANKGTVTSDDVLLPVLKEEISEAKALILHGDIEKILQATT